MQVVKRFKTRSTYMDINERHILIRDTNTLDQSYRAITVYPGFQIELGRDIEEYKVALTETRLPLVFRNIPIPSESCLNYQLIRMGTGNVKDKVILNAIVKHGMIHAVSFNKELRSDMEYRKYNQLSITNQLSLQALDPNNKSDMEVKFNEQVQNVIRILFKGFAEFTGAEYNNRNINIKVTVDNEELAINFIFNKRVNMYELVSMELI